MTDSIEHTELLNGINNKIVSDGETLPQVKLKDGSKVQTGTVATMLHNIRLYNEGQRGAIEQELIMAIPTLFKVGMFDLFSPKEWMVGNNPGRQFVGEYAQRHLDKINKL
jgi:hypothetical protein